MVLSIGSTSDSGVSSFGSAHTFMTRWRTIHYGRFPRGFEPSALCVTMPSFFAGAVQEAVCGAGRTETQQCGAQSLSGAMYANTKIVR
jgi:hypothetical protein